MKKEQFVALAYAVSIGIGRTVKTGVSEDFMDTYIFTQIVAHGVPKNKREEFESLVKEIYFDKIKPLLE